MDAIQKIYIALFGRPADPLGLAFFDNATGGGTNLTAIGDLAATAEYQDRFTGQSTTQIITSIYQSLFGRLPEQAGLQFFATALANGSLTINNIAVAIAQGAQGADLTILNNKVTAANTFTAAINTPEELNLYQGPTAANAGVAYLATVGADVASIPNTAAADAALAAIGTTVGTPIALTSGIDNVTGGSGADLILGTLEPAPTPSTANAGDIINGGNGADVLRIVSNGGGNFAPFMTNVETVEVTSFAGANINFANVTGVTNVALTNGTGSATFASVGALVAAAANNTQSGALSIAYLPAVTAGATDVQVATATNSTVQFFASGIEGYDLTLTGKNNVGLTSSVPLETVLVKGAGSGNFNGFAFNTLKSFDASANTGGVTATFTGGNVAVKGSTVADTFAFGTSFTKADTIDGGAGFDELTVQVSGDLSSAAAAAPYAALVSVERVHFLDNGAGITLNGSTFVNTGITNIQFDTNGADIINNAGSARTYEFGTPNTGSATFNMNGTSTVLNVDLLGATTASGVPANDDADVAGITVQLSGTQPATAVATLNLTSNGVGAFSAATTENGFVNTNANNVGTLTLKAGSTVVLDGAGDLDVSFLANKTIFDASAFTGKLEIEGSNIVGATGGDVFTLSTTTGRAEIEFGSGADSGVIVGGIVRVDTIENFHGGSGGDVLNALAVVGAGYTAIDTANQAAISALAGPAATLLAAANIAVDVADTGGTPGWTAFTFQGATYALFDADGGAGAGQTYNAGTDILVSLTGTDVSTLTAANFA